MKNEEKRCPNCKFWALVDSGYSNYTVTETTVHCLKKYFEPIEESYSWVTKEGREHPFLKQAETCVDYKVGNQVHFDVERMSGLNDFNLDDETRTAAIEYGLE